MQGALLKGVSAEELAGIYTEVAEEDWNRQCICVVQAFSWTAAYISSEILFQ